MPGRGLAAVAQPVAVAAWLRPDVAAAEAAAERSPLRMPLVWMHGGAKPSQPADAAIM